MASRHCGTRPRLLLLTDHPADLGGSDSAPPNRAARRDRDRRLLPFAGTAAHFCVSEATLQRWAGLGKITVYKIGRLYVLDIDEIEAGMKADPYGMRDGRRKRFGSDARIVTLATPGVES